MTKYLLFLVVCLRFFSSYANDLCANAIELNASANCSYTNSTFAGATFSGSVPNCTNYASQDVWFKFTATDAMMSITLNAVTGLNHGFEVIQGGCNGTVLHCVNGFFSNNAEQLTDNNFVVGQEYYIRVFNASATVSTDNFGICIRNYPSPVNNTCSTATNLPVNTNLVYTNGTFNGATKNGDLPICTNYASQDVWYKFTATHPMMSITLNDVVSLNHGFELIQGGCNGTVLQCVNSTTFNNPEHYLNNNFVIGQEYYVRVFNASGTLSTSTFGISIRNYPTPANNLCTNAQEITPTATCTYVNGTFSGSTLNGNIPACAPNSTQDVWFKFTATDSTMQIALDEVAYLNHGFEIIKGDCQNTPIQCVNNTPAYNIESYHANIFVPGQIYYIRVFNAGTTVSTSPFGICVKRYPSPINNLCQNATTLFPNPTCTYTTGTFSGAMKNGGTPSCAPNASQDVWYKFTATDKTMGISLSEVQGLNHGFEIIQGGCNGTVLQCVNNVPAYNSESYINNNFSVGQEYYIRVFNVAAPLSSSTFGICIRNFRSPVNDLCENATTITPATSCTTLIGTFSGALSQNGPSSCGLSASQDVWYKFIATDKTLGITLSEVQGLNHGFEIITGGCNGNVWQCVNNTPSYNSENYFYNNFTIGQEYYIRVFNAAEFLSQSSFNICIQRFPSPINDLCADARELTPYTTCNETYGFFSGSMLEDNAPSCAAQAVQDIWYKFKATTTTMSVQLFAVTGMNHAFQLFDGGCGGASLGCINQNGSGGQEMSTFTNLVVGQMYYIRVLNASNTLSYGNFMICVTGTHPSECTPSLLLTATATAICLGESVTFTATQTHGGTIPIYQWKINGANVGTNSTTYTSSTLSNGAIVSCTVTSNAPCASNAQVTSNTITMQVSNSTTPTFDQIPTVCYGSSINLPNTSINGVNGTWSPAANNTATTTYTFTPFNGQCSRPTTMTIVVSAEVAPTFTQVAPICSGGTFLLPTTSNNGINGTWSPAINNNITTTYTFTPNTAGQCVSTVRMTVTVNNQVSPTFTQVGSICAGGTFTLPTTSSNGINGTWSPAINTHATTTYTFTPASGQCANTTTMTVNVNNASTVPTFTQVSPICPGQQFTLPSTSTNGVNGTWSPALNNTATTTYTFTPNMDQCATTTTMTVSVSTARTTPQFAQVPEICFGQSFALPSTSINGVNGTWSPALNNNTTTTYTFTPSGNQCAETVDMTIVVKTVNTAITQTGNTITADAVGASYQWINCFDNQPINNATTAVFTATENGTYAVLVTQNGCTKPSNCVTINTLSISEALINLWNIYPNPALKQLFIEVDAICTISIIDVTGKTIQIENLINGKNVIDINHLTDGLYIIHSSNGKIDKFIKR